MSDLANEGAEPASGYRGHHDFRAFYMQFVPQLIGFLMSQGAGFHDAADVAQETMIKLHRRWREVDHPAAWSRKVASRDLVRRLVDQCDETLGIPHEGDILVRSSADVERWEARHDILRALRMLPPRQRQVMAWSLEGYTPTEIAEQLAMSPEAVRASLMKARRAVGKYLSLPKEDCQ